MLKGFLLSALLRGYAIIAGLSMQVLLSNITTKTVFGQINTFISSVLLVTFVVTSAPTRQLVRELGAFGLEVRRAFAEAFIYISHMWILVSIGIAFFAAMLGEPGWAVFSTTIGITFASAIYSAYFRGIGRYVLGNLEAGVIRTTAFVILISLTALLRDGLVLQIAQLLYLGSVAIGLLLLMLFRPIWPAVKFSRRMLWPGGGFPLTLTILAGLEMFFLNFDIILTNYLFGADTAAEVRVAQQLRSLTLLPLQIYLMFSFDRLSRALRAGAGIDARRSEITIVRVLLASSILVSFAIADPFGRLFFEGGTQLLTTIAVLSGVLPIVLLGPKAEVIIASSRENEQKVRVRFFLLAYTLLTPSVCWLFGLPPYVYFFAQSSLIAIFYFSLPRVI